MAFPIKITRKLVLLGIAFLLLTTLLVFVLLIHPSEQDIDSLMLEIYALATSTTIQDLEQEGFLNLTNLQPERIADIHAFLQGESLSRPTILKTVSASSEGPLIRVFYRPHQSSIVYMTTYDVVRQAVYSLNSTYYQYANEIRKDNCITEVWLEPHNDYEPILLYSYYCE